MSGAADDPRVHELRGAIGAVDRELVAAVNRRVELVAAMFAHKRALGYPIVDASREEELVAELQRTNPGPLSAEGVRELVTAVLALAKREVARLDGEG